MSRLTALLIVALLFVGCKRSPPPSSPSSAPSPVPFATAWPAPPALPPPAPTEALRLDRAGGHGAAGRVAGVPFYARSVTLWQDATNTYIAFEGALSLTDGHYDPRARHRPATAFLIWLRPSRIQVGLHEASWDRIPPESTVVGVTLQLLDSRTHTVQLFKTGWTVKLTIDRVITRASRASFSGTDVRGRIAVRFRSPDAWLVGEFVAHDILREDEVAPGQPAVPTPPVPERAGEG